MKLRRRARLTLAAAGAVLLGYLLLWAAQPGVPTDFSQTYVGAALIRDGHGAHLYDAALQATERARHLPAGSATLAFVYSPPFAALASPLALLDARTAYRVWSAVQLALVVAAVGIAVAAAPRPAGRDRRLQMAAAGTLAAAGFGFGVLVSVGQIDGIQVLGIALAYAAWRRGQHAWGGAALALTAAIGKPQLALGATALLLGWRERRVLLGAASGIATAVALSLAVAGPAGSAAYVHAALLQVGGWHLATMPALVGITGSWLGDTTVARLSGAVLAVVALSVAYALGRRLRANGAALDAALAGAVVLSLLAAPHTYVYDLSLLAPVAGWSLTAAVARDEAAPRRGLSRFAAVAATWVAVNVAAYLDALDRARVPPGQLAAWALIAAAALAVRATGAGVSGPGRPEAPRDGVEALAAVRGAPAR